MQLSRCLERWGWNCWRALQYHRSKNSSTVRTRTMSSNKAGSKQLPAAPRNLAAFDFDYTTVAQNTDTVVRDILPPDKLPKDLVDLIDTKGWTEYMAAVFRLLHENHYSPERIRDTVRGIPEVPGFVRLMKWLHQSQHCDLIIISDSNSVFIAEWLQAHGIADCFAGIFTNPAHFEADGLLSIAPYHHQTDCRLSAPNLCKGRVLEHFLVERDLRHNLRYERVIYVGDGNNDICPVLRLRTEDVACARLGFAMQKNLEKNREKMKLRAKLVVWKNGFDLLDQLQALLPPKEKATEIKN